MLSRRDVLKSAAAAGAAALVRPMNDLLAKASQPATPVNFAVPAGACDCHTHVFGAPQRFPFTSPRAYTPETASVEEMRALHRALHMERVVIVQPSVYGTDNSCTLDGVRQLGTRARAVAVIDDKTSAAALDEMGRAGVRGIRINLETGAQTTDAGLARQRFQAALQWIRGRNWHIQIYTRLQVIEGIREQVMAAPVPVVFDHFGAAQASLGTSQPGFDALVNLVRSGKAYVKVSAAYRNSTQAPDYADMAPIARALIAANPQRTLWATDWPHPDSSQVPGRRFTDIAPLLQIDDGRALNQFGLWAPDPALRRTILVDNPARLYGF
jgi:predicted TIM-barrel fold metal-dependent hydrolase